MTTSTKLKCSYFGTLRTWLSVFLLSYMTTTLAATSPHLNKTSDEWLAQAVKLQRDIDINAPLSEATFLATHNSYNSSAYAIPFLRYADPNQSLSLYDQLEAGVRSLELDIHWTLNYYFAHDILLCHGKANHLGCGMLGLQATQGLTEIKSWLETHPDEVVLLYLERHLDGHEPRMTAELEQTLGDFIYRPTELKQPNNACVGIPSTLTKADVLKAGKQLLIIADKCDSDTSGYQEQDTYTEQWNNVVFAGAGESNATHNEIKQIIMDDFTGYPDCNKSTEFNQDKTQTTFWRIYEDRTRFSSIIHARRHINANDIPALENCGINWVSLDMLQKNDDRLTAAIWSWAPDYPRPYQGNCAIYLRDSGVVNIPCGETVAAYSCQDSTTHLFQVAPAAGTAADGETFCRQFNPNAHFAMPVNANEMNQLKQAMQLRGMSTIWLNYKTDSGEHWVANSL